MKVHQSLAEYRDDKFYKGINEEFNALNEFEFGKKSGQEENKKPKKEDKTPKDPEKAKAEKLAQEDVKIGQQVIKHVQSNFDKFKKSAGADMTFYKAFWKRQAEGFSKLQSKGPYKVAYFYYDSPKVVAIKNVEGIISLEAIDIKENGIAYSTTNKEITRGFTTFVANMKKQMKEAKDNYIATVENQKKEAEHAEKKSKVQKFLKEGKEVKKLK